MSDYSILLMFQLLFRHDSPQSHYYTHKWTISHESTAVSELRNTVLALSWHSPIFGYLIWPL